MPFFMAQASYRNEQHKALIENPQDRAAQVARLFEAHGGKMHSFFFCFGEYDLVTIMEFPDKESAAAAALSASATGSLSALRTTVLMTSEEAQEAMRKSAAASAAMAGFTTPSETR